MPAHAQRMSSLLSSDRENVSCRVGRKAYGARRGVGREEGGGGRPRRTQHAGVWALHGEKRTSNMWTMPVYPPVYVTLEVSKLSGWLNADARCRVARRACDAEQGEAREAAGR